MDSDFVRYQEGPVRLNSKCEMTKNFLWIAIPSMITNLFNFSVLTVNMIFAGQFKDDSASKLAAVGLATTILAMLGRSIIFGLNAAQETLVA